VCAYVCVNEFPESRQEQVSRKSRYRRANVARVSLDLEERKGILIQK